MQSFHLSPTSNTPEILFSPEDNILCINGVSSPEDVRAIYYPVIKWITQYVMNILEDENKNYSAEKPLKFQANLTYFNSSSAKFLYDIFMELKKLHMAGIPLIVEWFYDKDDLDLKEAGADIAMLAEMEFVFIPKTQVI